MSMEEREKAGRALRATERAKKDIVTECEVVKAIWWEVREQASFSAGWKEKGRRARGKKSACGKFSTDTGCRAGVQVIGWSWWWW